MKKTAVLSESWKTFTDRGSDPGLHFRRTSADSEVKIVIETDGRLVPIEVRLSANVRRAMA